MAKTHLVLLHGTCPVTSLGDLDHALPGIEVRPMCLNLPSGCPQVQGEEACFYTR